MLKKTTILIIVMCFTLTLFNGCDYTPSEDNSSDTNTTDKIEINDDLNGTKIPSHPLYYSIQEDFPDYFYLWPTMHLGMIISEELHYYDVYGNISIQTSQSQYSRDVASIQVEIMFPQEGYRDDVYEIGIYEDLGLERLENGEWGPVPFDGDSDYYFNLFVGQYSYLRLSTIPSEGKTHYKQLNTQFLYAPLEVGHYRVILFLDDGTQRYAEFDVK